MKMVIGRDFFRLVVIGLFMLIGINFFSGFVNAVSWVNSSTNVTYSFLEDSWLSYNFTSNVTGYGGSFYFSLLKINGYENPLQIYPWFSWNDGSSSNSTTGVLNINSTLDNQTGFYSLLVLAQDGLEGLTTTFNFTINATNDLPYFVGLNSSYDFVAPSIAGSSPLTINLRGNDEESQFPLNFILKNFTSCGNFPSWSTRTSENCSLLYSINQISNETSVLNFTNISRNDIGVYSIELCINDTPSSLPPYPDSEYNISKQSCQQINLSILDGLKINATNCQNLLNLNESGNLVCNIIVSTVYNSELFNVSSSASLNGHSDAYISSLIGRDWFRSNSTQKLSSNYEGVVPINISLNKSYIGNWTINFSVVGAQGVFSPVSETLFFFINRSFDSEPSFSFSFSEEENKTSLNLLTRFYLNISDLDFSIPDKGLFNETINLSFNITNSTGYQVFWPEFQALNFDYSGDGSSMSSKTIEFIPNNSQIGNWTINFSYSDLNGLNGSQIFQFEVLNNTSPRWNSSNSYYFNCIVNSTLDTTDYCFKEILNLTEGFVTDEEGDTILFYLSGNYSSNLNTSFNKTSGVINFVPWKQDVSQYKSGGVWNFTITATDGFLNSSSNWILNITNINSVPRVQNFNVSLPLSIDEGNLSSVSFRVYDDDFLIPGFTFYRYSTVNLIETNVSLIGFPPIFLGELINISLLGPLFETNYNSYHFSIFPNKSNVGNYSVNISVNDNFGGLNSTVLNITITAINNAPEILNTKNISLVVGRELLSQFNVSDLEDGNSGDLNDKFIFNYSYLSGGRQDLDILNESNFNRTSGKINLTVNESYAGKYRINLTVTDSGFQDLPNKSSSKEFWIYAYNLPNITFPLENSIFEFSENSTFNFNFSVNHSVGDDLTYEFWIDNLSCEFNDSSNCTYNIPVLYNRTNLSAIGTNVSWQNYFGFNSESYNNLRNFTLVVYSPNLENPSDLSKNLTFKLNITHSNHPIELLTNISVSTAFTGEGVQRGIFLNLSNFFLDYDSLDGFYNEGLIFEIRSNHSSSIYLDSILSTNLLNKNTTEKEFNLYADIPTNETLTILAHDSEGFVSSNSFEVSFIDPPTDPETTESRSSGGGGTSTITKHASLLISVPSIIETNFGESLELPIVIKNNGEVSLSNIILGGTVFSESGELSEIGINLSKTSFSSLGIGVSEELSAKLDVATKKAGRYTGIIFANVSSPKFNQEGQFYIDIEVIPGQRVEELLIFTEQLVVGNPECIELMPRLDEARNLRDSGDLESALKLSQNVVDSCKKSISQRGKFNILQSDVSDILIYLFSSFLIVFLFLISFYVYKRVKFNKSTRDEYI